MHFRGVLCRRWGICYGSLVILGAACGMANAADDASPAGSSSLQEVVVTARKTEERIQDVPAAVSALTGASLEAMGAATFTDYARSIPGLTFTDRGDGFQIPTIRGVNPSVGAVAVGYYIEETPMPVSGLLGAAVSPTLIDIDRVEVLRGPQGTLYGSSSIGGTIKLIAHAPNLSQFEGSVQAQAMVTEGANGASPGSEEQLILNVPIVHDTFAVREAFWHRDAGGYINRTWTNAGEAGIATGPVAGRVGNLPDEHTWGSRTSLLFKPNEQFDLSAMAYVQHQHFDGSNDITGGPANPNNQLVQSFITDEPEEQNIEFQLYNLTAKYRFGRFNLLSSTSYSDLPSSVEMEGTSATQLFPTFLGQPASTVVVPNKLAVHSKGHTLTEEARLATSQSIAGFDAILGLFYSRYNRSNIWYWSPAQYNALLAGNDPANPLYAPANNLFGTIPPGESEHDRQKAAFGELTYHFTDSLSLTGGLRHYNVSNVADNTYNGWFIGGNNPAAILHTLVSASAQGNVYKGNLSYKLTADHLVYAQYAEGFRPGFGTTPLPPNVNCGVAGTASEVHPDSIKSYELGAKTSWLDRRLTINAAAYRINWSNIQQSVLLSCGFSTSSNFGSAVIKGAEFEVNDQLTRQMSVGLTGTYIHTDLQQDVPLTGNPLLDPHAGDPILAVPNWQYSVYAQTTFPLAKADDAFARVDYQYTGSSIFNYNRVSDGSFDPGTKVQVVRLLNLRTGLHFRHAWELALSGTNLFNNIARQSYDPNAGLTVAIPGRPRYVVTRPRTFALSVNYQF